MAKSRLSRGGKEEACDRHQTAESGRATTPSPWAACAKKRGNFTQRVGGYFRRWHLADILDIWSQAGFQGKRGQRHPSGHRLQRRSCPSLWFGD